MSDLGGLLPDLRLLWKETMGDPDIKVAVLDGPVDLSHPCFAGASLVLSAPLLGGDGRPGPALRHGTHIASILFGQHSSEVPGVAPRCQGIVIPIFADLKGRMYPASPHRILARAIRIAVEQGAQIINISASDVPRTRARADPLLVDAVNLCAQRNVLVIAAAGNDGCQCAVNPAALPSVLVAGAMGKDGLPLRFSNWGAAYQGSGVLVPGQAILGAVPGGGTHLVTGTSQGTAILTGIAALLLSLQVRRGRAPDPGAIRTAILETALNPIELHKNQERRRLLRGRLNLPGILDRLFRPPGHANGPAQSS